MKYFTERRRTSMEKAFIYKTNLGRFLIVEEENAITTVKLHIEKEQERSDDQLLSNYEVVETALIKLTSSQLKEYLDGKRKTFHLTLNPKGTDFQRKVWEALRAIPYGETRSYKQIAEAVGNPNASRAVGMANNKNPILCIIPCHRVIGADGKLVGFGCGLDVKEQLLGLERDNK